MSTSLLKCHLSWGNNDKEANDLKMNLSLHIAVRIRNEEELNEVQIDFLECKVFPSLIADGCDVQKIVFIKF